MQQVLLLSWLSAYQCDHSLTITVFISAPCGTQVENSMFSFQKKALFFKTSVGYSHLFVFTPTAKIFSWQVFDFYREKQIEKLYEQ